MSSESNPNIKHFSDPNHELFIDLDDLEKPIPRVNSDLFTPAEIEARRARIDERNKRLREQRRKEQIPLLRDLADIGIHLKDSIWDIYKLSPEDRHRAYPTILEHLKRHECSDHVMGDIARAFEYKDAVAYWDELKALFMVKKGHWFAMGLAACLAAMSNKHHYDEMIEMLKNDQLSQSRLFFIRRINRLGRNKGGKDFIRTLVDHPELGEEARRTLKGIGPSSEQ